jgi:hypothetical protein
VGAVLSTKILDGSTEWQERQRAKAELANGARSKAANGRRGAGGKLQPAASGGSRDPRQVAAKQKTTREEVAKRAGVSPGTVARAEALKKKAPGTNRPWATNWI